MQGHAATPGGKPGARPIERASRRRPPHAELAFDVRAAREGKSGCLQGTGYGFTTYMYTALYTCQMSFEVRSHLESRLLSRLGKLARLCRLSCVESCVPPHGSAHHARSSILTIKRFAPFLTLWPRGSTHGTIFSTFERGAGPAEDRGAQERAGNHVTSASLSKSGGGGVSPLLCGRRKLQGVRARHRFFFFFLLG